MIMVVSINSQEENNVLPDYLDSDADIESTNK
jgi:hypothetical protein